MSKSETRVERLGLRSWIIPASMIAIWFLLATHSAEAQEVQIPDFILAQVLGAVPEAREPMPTATVNLVAHRMQKDFSDQLIAGVSRPSVDLEVHFDWDSAELLEASVPEIEAAAEVLNRHFPETRFRVAGFTDPSGEPDYNMDLSKRRASAVWRMLVEEHGVAAERLERVGFGEESADDVATDEQRRRVELQILRQDTKNL